MFFYIALFLVFYCLGIKTYITGKKEPDILLILIITIVAYFVACRVSVGADWSGYVNFYYTKEVVDGRDFFEIEPLFRFSRDLLFFCGLSHQGFFFVFSFLSLFSLIYVAKQFKIYNISLVLLVYVSLFFCHNQLNVLRTCIMASFVWIGFAYINKNLLVAFLSVLVGACFHYIAVAYIPFIFLFNRSFSKKVFMELILLAFIFIMFSIGTKIMDGIPLLATLGRASNYLDPESRFREKEYGLTLGFIFNVLLCFYFRFKYNKEYIENENVKCILNILLVNILLASFLNGYPALIERVCGTLSLSLCFVWPYFLSKLNGAKKWHILILFSIYLILFYNKTLSNIDIWGDNNLVPFRFEFSTLLR